MLVPSTYESARQLWKSIKYCISGSKPEIDNDVRIGMILTRIKIGDVDILFTIQNKCLTGGLCVGYFARKCSMFLA